MEKYLEYLKTLDIPDGCKYIAMDYDGYVYAHAHEPITSKKQWIDVNNVSTEIAYTALGYYKEYESIDWKQSLVKLSLHYEFVNSD